MAEAQGWGNAAAEAHAAIRALMDAFDRRFPGRVRAYYVDGSFADGSQLVTSDLDMTIVVADAFRDDAERGAAEKLCQSLAQDSPIELDARVVDEATLAHGAHPVLTFASALIAGEDIRHRFPVMPLAEWTRDRMHAAAWLTVKLHGRPVPVAYPLGYPDQMDEFLGYTRRTIRLPDGSAVPTTRDLIRSTGWAATALIAHQRGQYVTRKRDAHALYERYIGDEWSRLLCDIYECCRTRWEYHIPVDPTERRALQAICEGTLGFENHFLGLYRCFLHNELSGSDDAGRAAAREALVRLPFAGDSLAHADLR
jgi:hypothetical protein